ncbi:Triose-phosphate Transporter [Apophysomyces ossiformis]|uniref:Triose-phosphate Transporter n=1 Tax=Apophysomyces ossiformis TaxID=679940 RepID=A0A8H7BU47_9FUNG|nr:Triose-phosphate Transporter [Apophysomyces ossiformis]
MNEFSEITGQNALPSNDDKKRRSGEYTDNNEFSSVSTLATPSTTPLRSTGLKKIPTSSPSVDASSSKPKRYLHSRTQSIHTHHVTVKKPHGRRGSLPPLHVGMTNKLGTADFSSPARSPYFSAASIPPLPEKGAISIQIANPKSDFINFHIMKHENIIKNAIYILLWYFFSTTLSLYNKNLMGRDRFNFHFPLLVSAIHAGLYSVITFAMVSFGGDRWNSQKSGQAITTSNYLAKVVPCGIAAALEICCSNASLVLVTLSFYTMVKSSTPIWVLLFSFIFGFEKPRVILITIILLMVAGVILTVEGETKFDTLGFLLVLVAAIVSGLRWNLTQLLLQQDQLGINNPIATLYYLSPVMFVTMLTLSFIFESPIRQFRHSEHFDSVFHILESFGLMAIGGVLAFAMTLAELYLIKNTNTVTLSVAGVSKEIVIITLSVLIYGDVLTSKNLLGLFVSIIGIISYNYYKLGKERHAEKNQYQMLPMHSNSKLED